MSVINQSLKIQLEAREAPLNRINIERLNLTTRSYRALRNARIDVIGELIKLDISDLLQIRNLGVTNVEDIQYKLETYLSKRLAISDWDSQIIQQEIEIENQAIVDEQYENTWTLEQQIDYLFDTLRSKRDVEVIKLRYGLEDGIEHTLEEVGNTFGVTRERIRQIQKKTLRKISHPSRKRVFDSICKSLEFVFQRAGGVLYEGVIYERLPQVSMLGRLHPIGITQFVLGNAKQFIEIYEEIWGLQTYPLALVPIVNSAACTELGKNRSRIRFSQLVSSVKESIRSSNEQVNEQVDTLFIEACIRADPKIEITADNKCALTKWQGSYLDEIIEVLREHNEPMHYSEITVHMNNLLYSHQKAVDRNIHAILQRVPSIFVRTGPGTYGLVEWKISRPNNYIDIIINILEDAGQPLPVHEIISRVNGIRPCKETTVFMYLTINDTFKEYAPKVYGLRKRTIKRSKISSEQENTFINDLKNKLAISLETLE